MCVFVFLVGSVNICQSIYMFAATLHIIPRKFTMDEECVNMYLKKKIFNIFLQNIKFLQKICENFHVKKKEM